MNARWRCLTVGFVFLLIFGFVAQGGSARENFQIARKGYEWDFPRDHFSHPDYRTEWWYLTGILESGQKQYGYQFTIFRQGLNGEPSTNSRWFSDQVYLGHFSWIDLNGETHRSFQMLSRELSGVAFADTHSPGSIRLRTARLTPGNPWQLTINQGQTKLQLRLKPTRPPLFQGPDGYSRKGSEPGQASQYYSFTRMKTEGRRVTASGTQVLHGITWFDQEFGSSQLSDRQEGWDWISLRLSNGADLMVYRLREEDGSITPQSSATIRYRNGAVEYIGASDWQMKPVEYWKSSETGARYPVEWNLLIPQKNINVTVRSRFPQQEMVLAGALTAPYWEGVIRAEGQWGDGSVKGEGFLEMTGYVDSLSGSF